MLFFSVVAIFVVPEEKADLYHIRSLVVSFSCSSSVVAFELKTRSSRP